LADSKGVWSFDTGHLSDGSHSFSSKASDVAGNVSSASSVKAVSVQDEPTASGVDITKFSSCGGDGVMIKGTADAYTQIKIFDGSNSVGVVKADANGAWSYSSSSVSDTTHTFSAKQLDASGHSVASSGNAILGSSGSNVLKGSSGDDIFIGNGNADTFVFAPSFGNDVIKDFSSIGPKHDVVQFSKSVFDSFADVLAHATQHGQDVVIATGADSLTLKNIKIGALDKSDFHFA
jgi:Ca2+-binding RTX toxin-like protein